MRILVTAGPTREHLDRVRFLSNAATGLMGIEVARAAAGAGHDAVLVLGPTHVAPPVDARIRVVRTVSAQDMLDACRDVWPSCDALVATAAVSDFRFAVRHDDIEPVDRAALEDRNQPLVAPGRRRRGNGARQERRHEAEANERKGPVTKKCAS